MTDKIEALFVGGPWDGERHLVERFPTYKVPQMIPDSPLSEPGVRVHEYTLKRYADAEGRIEWRYVCHT